MSGTHHTPQAGIDTGPARVVRLFDELLPNGACAVVDVGCGTGIVARLLIERGCSVIGVEPDPRMAQVATAHGLNVETSTFEDWDSQGRTYGVLTAGQSWHWVNPLRGAQKAASVLRSGGGFGVFWNGLRHDPAVSEGFERIYSRIAPHLLVDSVALGTTRPSGDPDEPAFEEVRAFTRLERRSYSWQRSYTTDTWLDELPTHSGHRTLSPEILARVLGEVGELIEGLGGKIVVEYTTAGLFGERR